METKPPRQSKCLLIFAVGLLAAVLLTAVVVFALSPGSPLQLGPKMGKPVPEFNLRTIDAAAAGPGDYLGQVVVVNFWATWCGPCQAEMPLFERTARSMRGRVVFLAVNDNESLDEVRGFARRYGLSFPVLLDPGGKITGRYFVNAYPTTFFIDAEGILRAKHIGSLDEESLVGYLEAAGAVP